MKKIILVFMVMTVFISISLAKVKSVSVLSPKSLYIYVEGSSIGINPYEPYDYDRIKWKSAMIYGTGFTLLNFHNRYKINFEFDFSNPNYSAYDDNRYYNQKINIYNYKLNFEYLFKRGKLSFFGGIGVSNIRYQENDIYYAHSITVMLVECGLKIAITKNVFLRAELKHIFDPSDSDFGYYDYYYDEDYPIASAFAVGLELKF